MHGLAVNYHWTEEQIFSLPFVRLLAYRAELQKEHGRTVMEDEPDSEELEALRLAMVEVMAAKRQI